MKQRVLVPMLVFLSFSGMASAEVYRCTDDGGGVQYRDSPCDSRTHSLRKIDEPADTAGMPDVRREKTQRLLDAMREERQLKQQQAEEEKAEQAQRRRRCNHARDYLRNLEQAGRVYDLDESGRRVYLPDEGRERALAEARARVQHWCN